MGPPFLACWIPLILTLAACTTPTPPTPTSTGVSGLALGLSAPDFGLTTLWLEVEDGRIREARTLDGLHLLTETAGPQHRQEVAARASQDCAQPQPETCALLLARVVPGPGAAPQARSALLQQAAQEVRCFQEYSLERVHSASPRWLTLSRAEGSAPCAQEAGEDSGYDSRSHTTLPWSAQDGGEAAWLAPEQRAALHQEALESHPHLADPETLASLSPARLWERAAGVRRTRAVLLLPDDPSPDPAEASLILEETVEPVDFTAVLARWPDAIDVLLSPQKDLALVRRSEGSLLGVRIADGAVVWQTAQPQPGRIVLAEWPQGEAAVARWAAVMAEEEEEVTVPVGAAP